MQIANHVFLITGGASGLGAATVRTLAGAGGQVVIADINHELGLKLAAELGSQAVFAECNVTDEGQVKAAVDLAVARFGRLDAAINCAGVATGERVVGKQGPHSLLGFERTIKINLIGSFNVVRLAAHQMSQQAPDAVTGERGVLINTASVAAFDGQIGQAAYAASKAGIVGMARLGIRIMTVAPGIFDTPMLQGMSDEVRASLAAQVPFPSRLGRPEEYAQMVRHIIENEMLNGEVIRLDGAIRMTAK
jgi:NAD(P)-dependent dehydrogenase (short-subunit alcohol dehydrogenase family)